MTHSIKRRLLAILLGLILLSWVGSAAVTAFYASRVLLAQVDLQLEQYADLVNYITRMFERQLDQGLPVGEPWLTNALTEGFTEPMVVDNSAASGVSPALNVWHDGRLLAVLRDSPRFAPPQREGYSFGELPGERSHWRLLTRKDGPTGLWIVVGIDLDQARVNLLTGLGRVLFPLLVILPLTLVVLYFGVERGLLPLKTLAGQISRRNPRALDPVQPVAVPAELEPVVAELNDLLGRLASALEAEQRFTANAAHELTTPLAAIKAEVQLCQRRLRDDPPAGAMLERIAARVDRAHHTVEQLLTLARLDPEAMLAPGAVDLDRLLREVLAETGHLAVERGLSIITEGIEPARISGSDEALAILLRNLLGNAFRYASEGSAVAVALAVADDTVTLKVRNDCPPLAVEAFRRLKQRFYRVPGSRGPGAGLGLSIVERVATLHGGEFTVEPGGSGGGFAARVVFPARAG